jgi:hypothetical protein
MKEEADRKGWADGKDAPAGEEETCNRLVYAAQAEKQTLRSFASQRLPRWPAKGFPPFWSTGKLVPSIATPEGNVVNDAV